MSKKKYALGYAFTSHDLFMNFPVDKLKMTVEQCKQIYSDGNKRDLAASIFIDSVKIIIDDIIENNVQFKLPVLGTTQSYINVKRTFGEKFKKAFKNGKWRDVDFLVSNFSGYQLEFEMQGKNKITRTKPIYLSSEDKDRLTTNVNNGKQY